MNALVLAHNFTDIYIIQTINRLDSTSLLCANFCRKSNSSHSQSFDLVTIYAEIYFSGEKSFAVSNLNDVMCVH